MPRRTARAISTVFGPRRRRGGAPRRERSPGAAQLSLSALPLSSGSSGPSALRGFRRISTAARSSLLAGRGGVARAGRALSPGDGENAGRSARGAGGAGLLQGRDPVEVLLQPAGVAVHLREPLGRALGELEHHVEPAEVTQDEVAVGDPADRSENRALGRELEVHGALRQHAVLELEASRGIRNDVREDPLDLRAGRLAQLALADHTRLREHLRQRLSGTDLGIDVLELLGGDLAVLDEDRAELVARVVGGAEEDATPAEVERLLVRGTFDLEGSGGRPAVKIDEKEGKGLGINAAADRKGFGHPPPACRKITGNSLRHKILTRRSRRFAPPSRAGYTRPHEANRGLSH